MNLEIKFTMLKSDENLSHFLCEMKKFVKKAIFSTNCNYYQKKNEQNKKLAGVDTWHNNEILGLLS